jgi:hypothetical protein
MNEEGYIVPVPYAIACFASGQRTLYMLGVEVPAKHLLEYVEHGHGRLDLDYIIAIYPYSADCPLDEEIKKNPKFKNIPVKTDWRK